MKKTAAHWLKFLMETWPAKKLMMITMLALLFPLLSFSQTVTVSSMTLGAPATYTFTYTTSSSIGTGTSTPNIFLLTKPTGYANFVGYTPSSALGPYVVLKINGTATPINANSFGNIGGSWANGIQISTGGAAVGTTIAAGSTIELIVTGIITNPSSSGNYTFSWKTAQGSGTAVQSYSSVVNFAAPCTDPTIPTITATPATICPSASSTLTITGTLNSATAWKIYSGSCGGSYIGSTSTSSFAVTPGTNTTYYIRGEGGCVTPGSCGTVSVNIQDITTPLTPTLADVTGQCSATAVAPTTTDDCAGTITGTTSDALTYSTQGTHVIAWTFNDGNGNSIIVNQNVIVTDISNPTITAPATVNATTNTACTATGVALGTPVTADNCTVASVTNNHASTTYPLGATTVTWTVTDGAGNTATATQTVNVTDNVAPTVVAQNFTVNLDAAGNGTVSQANILTSVTDNCTSSPSVTLTNTAFSCTDVGAAAAWVYQSSSICANYSRSAFYSDASGIYMIGKNNTSSTIDLLKWNTTDWTLLSTSNIAITTNYLKLSRHSNGTFLINVIDVSYKMYLFKYDTGTSTWSELVSGTVNSQFNLSSTYDAANFATNPLNGDVWISFVPSSSPGGTYAPNVLKYDGTNLTLVGYPRSGITTEWTNNCDITFTSDGKPTVLFGARNNPIGPFVVSYNGTSWFSRGSINGILGRNYYNQIITSSTNEVYISFYDATSTISHLIKTSDFVTWTSVKSGTASDLTSVSQLPAGKMYYRYTNQGFIIDGATITNFTGTTNVNLYSAKLFTDPQGGYLLFGNYTTLTGNARTYKYSLGNSTSYSVSDASGNITSGSVIITVNDLILPTIAASSNVTYNVGAGTCTASVATTNPTTADNCSVTKLTWALTGATTATSAATGINNVGTYTFNLGVTTVTYTVYDASGNLATGSFTVTVSDNINPTVTAQSNTTANVGAGTCVASIATTNPTAADNCSVSKLTWALTGVTTATSAATGINNVGTRTFNLGITTVTYTVYDAAGNLATASFTVTVSDNIIPTITSPATVNATTNTACTATGVALGTPVTADNCTVATVTNNHASTTYPLGATTVTWTVTDGAGNTATSTQTVTITDNVNPTITAPATINATTNTACTATGVALGTPTTADNCSVATVTNNHASTTYPLGATTVTWTVTDGSGRTATATQTVNVTDNVNPTITAPATVNVTTNTACTATGVALGTPVTADNCTVATVTNNHASTTYPLGATTVTWTVTDGSGRTATATQTVNVTDNINPIIPTLTDVTGECSATAVAPTTTDDCAGTLTGTTTDALTYSTQGTHVIAWTFDDGNGNSITVNQNVIVADVTNPIIPTLTDVTGECSATAVAPTTTDDCAGTLTGTTTDALTYSTQGTHVIAWTFDDGNGNSITVNQNVIVADVANPIIPTLTDVNGECSATAVAPTTTDDCAGTITGTTTDALTYSTQGTHVIAWTFDDGNGNSIIVNQNVIVDDITNPIIPTLADVNGECSATAVASTTTDDCAGTLTGTTTDALTYSTQGTHVIAWTFDDGNGNSIIVNQNVIVDDITNPIIPTLADVNGECSATAVASTTTDDCAGTLTGTTTDALTYSTQGTHVIAWTFDDGNGNSITVNQNVIVADVTNPIIPTLTDVNGECSATAVAPITTDDCAGTLTGTTTDALTYSTQGTHVIAWTFDDGNGNSITVNQNIIVDDVTNPIIPILTDVTGECSATALAPITTDDCAGTITGTTTDALTYSTQGTYVIAWTFNDGNGNSIIVNQNVIVADVTNPIIPILTDVTGECSATALAPITTDDCAGTITGTTTDALTYSTQGTYVIAWTFNDGNGNSIIVNQNVIVADVTAPTFSTWPTVVSCDGHVASIAPLFVSDNCSSSIAITYTLSGATTASGNDDASNEVFNVGTTLVTYSLDDGNGNISQFSFNVSYQLIDVTVTVNQNVLTANGTGTYQWYDCTNNVSLPNETSQSYTALVSGDYSVIVSNNGCVDTSNCITVSMIGISSQIDGQLMGISVYPNPTDGIVYLNSSFGNPNLNVSIVDINGKVVYTHSDLNSKSNMLDIQKLCQGVYIIKISNERAIRIIKLIKQ